VKKNIIILIFILIFPVKNIFSQITVESNFEGGNAQVISINNPENTVKIKSQLRLGDIYNSVFLCKILGHSMSMPLKIQLQFTNSTLIPYLGAYSPDFQQWLRTTGTVISDYKEFMITNPSSAVYFSVGYPYLYTTLINHLNLISSYPHIQISNLCQSNLGRQVKLVKITDNNISDTGKYLVWILARQHAFESHSSWVIDGLLDFFVSNDNNADRLRKQAIIYLIPMMDVDQVFLGGTGKDQNPVDFNRDWDSPSYWNAVIAAKNKIFETALQNPLKIFFDSHNPWPSDHSQSSRLFLYSLQESGIKSNNLDTFRLFFESIGGYPLNRQPLYPTAGQTSSRWADSLFSSLAFSVSMETGFINRTDNTEWTIPLYRNNGIVLGKTFNDFLSNLVKPGDIIIDNTDSAKVQISGQWYSSNMPGGYWGNNYYHDGNQGKGEKSVKYIPEINENGFYEVSLRWTSLGNRPVNVPVKITYVSGIKDTLINQQIEGSRWVSLGIFFFSSGYNSSVLIKNDDTQGYVIADAVRFSKRAYGPVLIYSHEVNIPVYEIYSYPNPFNPTTNISFQNNKFQLITIEVFDIKGNKISILLNKKLNPGKYNILFNGSNFPSGVYFYRIINDKITNSGKMILIK
jgi:hypothetical protein